LIETLATITTRDHAGVHFTANYTPDELDALEQNGWIVIRKPVHEATGLEYSEEHWSVEVTEAGAAVVEGEYEEQPRTEVEA
jgi:hypothetical protein